MVADLSFPGHPQSSIESPVSHIRAALRLYLRFGSDESGEGNRYVISNARSRQLSGVEFDLLAISLAVVSAAEIFAELPKLSREERRRLTAAIFELDEDADLLRDCDRRADEHFRTLDVMEERDAIATRHCEV